jgi:hypothetical protein
MAWRQVFFQNQEAFVPWLQIVPRDQNKRFCRRRPNLTAHSFVMWSGCQRPSTAYC